MGEAWPSTSSLPDSATPATRPGLGQGKKKDHGFKVSADGRLIIREEEDVAPAKMEEEDGAKGRTTHPSQDTAAAGLGWGCAHCLLLRSFSYHFLGEPG